jgi:hypothetical protein
VSGLPPSDGPPNGSPADGLPRLDTPLTRLKSEYEGRVLARDTIIHDLRLRIEAAQMQLATVKGVNQLLRLLLADMASSVDLMAQQVAGMAQNIAELRQKLPILE